MGRKPEATFRDSVHRHMREPAVHTQPMGNVYSAGTPDTYYESNKEVLWVEWKFWKPVVPPAFNLVTPTMKSHKTKLSPLQYAWGKRAVGNGVNWRCIVGCPEGGVVFTLTEAEHTWSRESFMALVKSRKELAHWLEEFVYNPFYNREDAPTRRGR